MLWLKQLSSKDGSNNPSRDETIEAQQFDQANKPTFDLW